MGRPARSRPPRRDSPAFNAADPPVHQVTATTSGSNQCQAPDNLGHTVPCNSPDFGWLGSDGCYYKADPTFQPPASDTADQPPAGETGGYYVVTCAGQGQSTNGGIVWLPSGSAAAAPVLPSPAVLAQQAVSQLTLPTLQINASPSTGADQLVGLPTWVWLGGGMAADHRHGRRTGRIGDRHGHAHLGHLDLRRRNHAGLPRSRYPLHGGRLPE